MKQVAKLKTKGNTSSTYRLGGTLFTRHLRLDMFSLKKQIKDGGNGVCH